MGAIGVQHQIRRDTTANLNSYTGPQGEYLFNTSVNRLVFQDGATQGGFPSAMAKVQTITASTTVAITTAVAMVMSTASGIVVTLPPVASYPSGQFLTVADGLANSSVANIVITTSSTTEKIFVPAGTTSTSVTLSVGGNVWRGVSNSSAAWVAGFVY